MSDRPMADCDCCGRYREVSQCWAFGNMETWACDECRGVDDDSELQYMTETGEIK